VDEIMTLKLTGERVFVLDNSLNGKILVRRPSMGPNGITHSQETFYLVELETLEDNIHREINEVLLKNRISQEITQKESQKNLAGQIKDIAIN
jgi:hypothetical protein